MTGRLAIVSIVVLAVLGLLASACSDGDGDGGQTSARQEEVAERGAEVMPFDLEATTHHFEPTGEGLLQTVVADIPTDGEQVTLIQEHLTSEAERFRAGDYSDPEAIHGESMPGLRELEAGAEAITIDYRPLAEGAEITFTSDRPALIDALHRWGEAQTLDHGNHAEP